HSDKQGATTTITYGPDGRVSDVDRPENIGVSLVSSASRVPSVAAADADDVGSDTNPAPAVTPAEKVAAYTDPRGQPTLVRYDALGLPAMVEDALGGRAALVHDAAGGLQAVTNRNGVTTRLSRNSANRLTRLDQAVGTA